MRSLKSHAKHSLQLSRMLGVWPALNVLSTGLAPGDRRAGAVLVRPAGYPPGMWIRPGGSDLDVVLQVFGNRDYDLDWFPPYKHHIEATCAAILSRGEVPVIIDAGANIGASTLWFSTRFPDAQIIAIEPDPANHAMLLKNTAGRPNVTAHHAGLWDCPAEFSILSDQDDSWAKRVAEAPDGTAAIRSVTIPELLGATPGLRPLIVKIDIEGAETSVFRSNTDWVDEVPLLIFEPHDNLWSWLGTWQGTGHAFFSTLARRKHEYLFRGENVFAFLHPEPPAAPDGVGGLRAAGRP